MWILSFVIEAVIPIISAYLASDDMVVTYLIKCHFLAENFNIQIFHKICLLINIISTLVVLYFQLAYHKRKVKQCRKEIAGLYNVIKQFAQSDLASISGNKNFSFDLRIFVPEIRVWDTIKSFLFSKKKEKWFVIRNIEPFARKDITEHLRFRVEPAEQGLVGSAYISKSIVYDDMLMRTNSINYSLEQSQLSRTSNLLWSICVPIMNEKNTVIAVMAFDSNCSKLDIIHNKTEIRSLTNTLAIMMKDSVPELFKRQWSIFK